MEKKISLKRYKKTLEQLKRNKFLSVEYDPQIYIWKKERESLRIKRIINERKRSEVEERKNFIIQAEKSEEKKICGCLTF